MKSCGKTRYLTSHKAQAVLTRITRRSDKHNRRPTRVYLCPRCHGWHLTANVGISS